MLTDGQKSKTALFLACENRSPAFAWALLQYGADVSLGRLDEGTTPMHLAAGWLHSAAVVEVLLNAESRDRVVASLMAKPHSGGLRAHTPVFWAGYYGHAATRARLIDWMLTESGWAMLYDEDEDEFHHAPEN